MKVLFVNGCIRAEESRTLKIAKHFLDTFKRIHNDAEVIEENINGLRLAPLYHDTLNVRNEAFGNWDDSMFDCAKRFKNADMVVIAAPFWEGTFPAAVHTYIEHICVTGLTFDCTDRGYVGCCSAEKAVFITTRGGIYSEGPAANDDHASAFLGSVLKMLGIPELYTIAAEGLDIEGFDIEGSLSGAFAEAEKLADEIYKNK